MLDLFTPIVPEEKQAPIFRRLLKRCDVHDFDVLTDWCRGFVDRDNKFVHQFQTTFESSFWELYLHAVFKEYGFSFDWSNPHPDFVMPNPGMTCEAVITSNTPGEEDASASWQVPIPDDLGDFNKKAILRITNSVHSKLRKYSEIYSRSDFVRTKPFVLAVAPFDRPYHWLECQRAIESVLWGYWLDETGFLNGKYGSEISDARLELPSLRNHNGAEIDLALFKRPQYSHLSAVIWNSSATWGKVRALSRDVGNGSIFNCIRLNTSGPMPHVSAKPKPQYYEALTDGLRIYHNPNALHPLPLTLFRKRGVFQARGIPGEAESLYEQYEGQLMCRWVTTISPESDVHS